MDAQPEPPEPTPEWANQMSPSPTNYTVQAPDPQEAPNEWPHMMSESSITPEDLERLRSYMTQRTSPQVIPTPQSGSDTFNPFEGESLESLRAMRMRAPSHEDRMNEEIRQRQAWLERQTPEMEPIEGMPSKLTVQLWLNHRKERRRTLKRDLKASIGAKWTKFAHTPNRFLRDIRISRHGSKPEVWLSEKDGWNGYVPNDEGERWLIRGFKTKEEAIKATDEQIIKQINIELTQVGLKKMKANPDEYK